MSNQPDNQPKELFPLRPVRHSYAIVAIALMLSLSLYSLIQGVYGVQRTYLSLLMQMEDMQANAIAAQRRANASGQTNPLPLTATESRDTNRIIVKFKERDLPPGLSIAVERANLERAQGLRQLFTIARIQAQVYEVSADDTAEEVIDRLLATRGDLIEYAEVDRLVPHAYTPNDPELGRAWHINKIQAPTAWDSTRGEEVIIAIADTGVNCNHPDLAVSCVAGWNTASNNNDTSDIHGHGTAVAGAAAQVGDNARGSAGVAYTAKIMPMRITDSTDGYAFYSAMASAINWAADQGARVVNLSYQGTCGSNTIINAANYLRSKGGVLVVSAGNSGSNPGYAPSDSITCVSATASNDTLASWSSFGNFVDLSAPGVSIYTTTRNGSYGNWNGTSFSSPVTAGVYALAFAANPALTPTQADQIVFSTADDLGTAGWADRFGWGRVNAAQAVAAALAAAGGGGTRDTTPDTVPPSVPQNLRTTDIKSTSVSLAWNASTDDRSGVAGYSIYRNGTKLADVAGTLYSDSGLTPNTTYTYTVRAEDGAGNVSADSTPLTFTTADVEFAITSQSVPAKTANSGTVAITLNKPGAVTVRYGTNRNNLNLSAQSSTANTNHSVSLTNLTAKTTYYYQIVATDGPTTITSPVYNFKTANAPGGGGGNPRNR